MEFLINDDKKDGLRDIGLLVLRLWAGIALFAGHGLGKLTDFAGTAENFDGMLGLPGPVAASLAIFGEAVCSLLVAAGLLTRLAAIPAMLTMAVATYSHLGLRGQEFWAAELAITYGSIFLMFIFTGPGKFSLDTIISKAMKSE